MRFDDGALVVETADVERFGRRLPALAREAGATLRRVEPLGDDLESVYAYLTETRAAGGAGERRRSSGSTLRQLLRGQPLARCWRWCRSMPGARWPSA